MKKKKMIRSSLMVFLIVFILTGCGSMRVSTTLKSDPETQKFAVADKTKFSIVQLNKSQDKQSTSTKFLFFPINMAPVNGIDVQGIQKHATDLYPGLFGNNFSDLPVFITVEGKYSGHESGEWLQNLTFGTIPFPSSAEIEYKVRTQVPGEGGYVVDETHSFTQKFSWWRTIYTPFGLLPIPGFSDLRKTDIIGLSGSAADFGGTKFKTHKTNLVMESLTEAVAQSIRQADQNKLKAAAEYRKSRIRQIDISGQTFWSFLGFDYSDPKLDGKSQYDVALITLYSEYPTWDAKPVEQVIVAQMKNAKWEPTGNYLRSIKPLTVASALIENGKPSKVVFKEVVNPPLEHFIELPRTHTGNDIRWSNGILIEAKNSSLPLLIQKESPEYLSKLITRIEKEVLALNEMKMTTDSMVQQMMMKGQDPKGLSEFSLLYNQRITILQGILASLKQAASKSR
jgi:hypothetical protein